MIAPPTALDVLMPAIEECAGKGNAHHKILFINRCKSF